MDVPYADFLGMPRIPESAFRPHIPMQAANARLNEERRAFRLALENSLLDDEVNIIEDEEFNRPIGEVERQVPRIGYDGARIGMARCKECKSWYHPTRLIGELCHICRPKGQVNSQVNKDNENQENRDDTQSINGQADQDNRQS